MNDRTIRQALEASQDLLAAMLHETRERSEIEAQIAENRAALAPSPAASASAEPSSNQDDALRSRAAEDGAMADAYVGAREDLSIWKKRALEAEALNRKFIAEINGPVHMGEPVGAALAANGAEQREPIYQIKAGDYWRDLSRDDYERLSKTTPRDNFRIVPAAPADSTEAL